MGKLAPVRAARLKAATLLESVLAMGMMAAALSFAVGLHFRVLSSDRSADRLQAWTLTEQVFAQRATMAIAPSIASEAADPNGSLRTEVQERTVAPGLVEVTITCSRGERTILERRGILPIRP
jgi:hypothetical protein